MNDGIELPQYRAVTMQSRGCLYDVELNAEEHQFYLTVEKDESFERWSCIFDHEAVRAITEHVKSSKSYKIFVGMLLLAIEESEIMQGDSTREHSKNREVAIQIFTEEELKKLDSRMQDPGDEKLYVVLTYKTDVENSFYVLPLIKIEYNQDQDSNEQYLFEEYKKVKSELMEIKEQNIEIEEQFKVKIEEIKEENEEKECINCDVLTEEIEDKNELILELQEEKDEIFKTIELLEEGKKKYKAKYKDMEEEYAELEQENKHIRAKLEGSEAQLLKESKNSRLGSSRQNTTGSTSRPGSNVMNSRASSRDSVISASSKNNSIISEKPKSSSKSLKTQEKPIATYNYDSKREISLKTNSNKYAVSSRDSSLSEDTFNRSISGSINRVSRSGFNSRASSNNPHGLSSARNSLLGSGASKKTSGLPQMSDKHSMRSRSTDIQDEEASTRSHRTKRSSSRGKRQEDIDNITNKIEMLQKIVEQFNK